MDQKGNGINLSGLEDFHKLLFYFLYGLTHP